MRNFQAFWESFPGGDRVSRGLCRRLACHFPGHFSEQLKSPIFFVGFNNGGKSRLVNLLRTDLSASFYPDEGNGEFWFRDFFPWAEAQPDITPIWYDPDAFVAKVLAHRSDNFQLSRAYLGAYQYLMNTPSIVNDSGMLGALVPDMYKAFPDAKFVHVIRDGRVASYLSARREWCNMMRSPAAYQAKGCSLDFQDVLARMIRYWAWTVKRVKSVAEQDANKIFEIRYEDWCEKPEGVYHELVQFVENKTPSQKCLKHLNLKNMNDIVLNDYTERDIETVQRAAGKELKELGYC